MKGLAPWAFFDNFLKSIITEFLCSRKMIMSYLCKVEMSYS